MPLTARHPGNFKRLVWCSENRTRRPGAPPPLGISLGPLSPAVALDTRPPITSIWQGAFLSLMDPNVTVVVGECCRAEVGFFEGVVTSAASQQHLVPEWPWSWVTDDRPSPQRPESLPAVTVQKGARPSSPPKKKTTHLRNACYSFWARNTYFWGCAINHILIAVSIFGSNNLQTNITTYIQYIFVHYFQFEHFLFESFYGEKCWINASCFQTRK